MILLSGVEIATTTDLLANTRLSSIPFGGLITMQFQADLNDATNNWVLTVELPDISGGIPVDAQRVPATNPALGGVLDERTLLQMSFPAALGGRFIITLTESGTAIVTWRVALR